MRTTLSLVAGLTLAFTALQAQTSTPIIVQAAGSAAAQPQPLAPAAPVNAASAQSALKSLQDMKAANDETLKKQQAVLQQLDEIQKAADQIRIYSKRS